MRPTIRTISRIEFAILQVGPNKGEKVPTELAALLQANSRVNPDKLDLSKVDYDVDVLDHRRRRRRLFCGD